MIIKESTLIANRIQLITMIDTDYTHRFLIYFYHDNNGKKLEGYKTNITIYKTPQKRKDISITDNEVVILHDIQDYIDKLENRDMINLLQNALDDCYGFMFNEEGDQKC